MAQIYFLTNRGVSRQSARVLQLVANQVIAGDKHVATDQKRHRQEYFYAVIDRTGAILETSPSPPFVHGSLTQLITQVVSTNQPGGTVEYQTETYRFERAVSPTNGNIVLVFSNYEADKEILAQLLHALVVTGFIALILVFIGGLFMAERALVPIRNAWRRQKNFAADASHELRTPLAVIQTNLELVLGNPDSTIESQANWLENIQTETHRMTRLVDDLLFLARADSDQEILQMDSFLLNRAVHDALTPLEPVAANNEIALKFLLATDASYYGDETRIKQLAVILVDNAIKYTPAGGAVTVEVKNSERGLELIVSDTGVGIERENLGKVFERFYRVDKSRSRADGSSGLGLSIAQWIASKHRGIIKVNSTPGQGTTFQVILPK